MKYAPPIQREKSAGLRDILTEDTSVFYTYVFFSGAPLHEKFVSDVERSVEELRRINPEVSVYLAIDCSELNQDQLKSVSGVAINCGLRLFDLSSVEHYISHVELCNILDRKVTNVALESLDRSKALVAGMAGRYSFGNILCLDADVVIESAIYVKDGTRIAFTYTPTHKNPSVLYDVEFSMIFADARRPTHRGKDLFDAYHKRFSTVVPNVDAEKGSYGAWTHSTIAVDPLVDIEKDEARKVFEDGDFEQYLSGMIKGLPPFAFFRDNFDKVFPEPTYRHPSIYGNDLVSETRAILANYANRNGDHIIHGNYYSDNHETWKEKIAA